MGDRRMRTRLFRTYRRARTTAVTPPSSSVEICPRQRAIIRRFRSPSATKIDPSTVRVVLYYHRQSRRRLPSHYFGKTPYVLRDLWYALAVNVYAIRKLQTDSRVLRSISARVLFSPPPPRCLFGPVFQFCDAEEIRSGHDSSRTSKRSAWAFA